MQDNQTYHVVTCGDCGEKIVISLLDNTRNEVSEHLKTCIPKIEYGRLRGPLEIPFDKIPPFNDMSKEEFLILKEADIDWEKRIVRIRTK